MTKPNDFFSDDLSDLLGGDTAPTARELPQDEAFARIRANGTGLVPAAKAFQVTCPKCQGRGRFISYAGRDCGACYTCQGKGKLERKTNPVQLERAAERRQEQKAAIRQEAAPQIAWIQKTLARGDKLPATFADILRNCLEALQAGRILSEGRQGVIDRGMARDAQWAQERAQKAAQAPVAPKPAPTFPTIQGRFDELLAKGVRRAQMTAGDVNLSLADITKGNPGAVYVKEAGTYVGKIVKGTLYARREASADLVAKLVVIEADPRGAVMAHAKMTAERLAAAQANGEKLTLPCGCCGRALSDPISVARGIGPVCAEGWDF